MCLHYSGHQLLKALWICIVITLVGFSAPWETPQPKAIFILQLKALIHNLGKSGQKLKQELKQKAWKNTYCSLACSPWFDQAPVLQSPSPPNWDCHFRQWAGPTSINQQFRKCPTALPTGQPGGGNSSTEVPFHECAQLTRENSYHGVSWFCYLKFHSSFLITYFQTVFGIFQRTITAVLNDL